jgi:hypothetical protein
VASRPIFLPSKNPDRLVDEVNLPLHWHSGFAPSQKQRNIVELHAAARDGGFWPILEVSTKSSEEVGQRLSAFNLKIPFRSERLPIETAFQGSKVFESAGPFTDLYFAEPHIARRDERLKNSGELIGFRFDNAEFPTKPVTAFYDWLYLNAIYPHRDWMARLECYAGFSDIEFNPEKSVNCQARSCALFFALGRRKLLDNALASPEIFVGILRDFSYMPELPKGHSQSHASSSERPSTIRSNHLDKGEAIIDTPASELSDPYRIGAREHIVVPADLFRSISVQAKAEGVSTNDWASRVLVERLRSGNKEGKRAEAQAVQNDPKSAGSSVRKASKRKRLISNESNSSMLNLDFVSAGAVGCEGVTNGRYYIEPDDSGYAVRTRNPDTRSSGLFSSQAEAIASVKHLGTPKVTSSSPSLAMRPINNTPGHIIETAGDGSLDSDDEQKRNR